MTGRFIKRTMGGKPLWEALEQHYQRQQEWAAAKTVCVVRGLAGSGKTTYLLEYFKNKKTFYFSFAGLGEDIAEKLFAEYASEKTGVALSGWEDGFAAISKAFKVILLDDLSSLPTYKRFHKAFYDNMITGIHTRPFIALIAQPSDNVNGLADQYVTLTLDYFSVPEVMKLFPALSKFDILGLCAVSGGIHKVLEEYDVRKSFTDNLRDMLAPSSAFVHFMPELLSRYFRRPECYHHILCAIAHGNRSVSEIGKFTGYAYNKCDNYLSGLVSHGFVKTENTTSGSGIKKTAYILPNSYFKLWHKYIFLNRTRIQLENIGLVDNIIQSILGREIHSFHLWKAFALANARVYSSRIWNSFRISEEILYAPQIVCDGDFSYTFDAIARNGEKAVFVKVFENPMENCGRNQMQAMRKAVMLANKYYDSHIYIFTKRRFSDYAVKEAAGDDAISLVEVDRLKY